MSNILNEYVKKPTNAKSELAEVMDRRQNEKVQELDNIKLDVMIAEEKKKLAVASPDKIDPAQATNFATMMFAGRTPAEIKEIIHSLTQEEIDKFAYMSARMDPNNFSNVRGLMREPNTTAKEIVEAVKLGVDINKKPESSGIDMKGIAEIFKAGVEAARVQQPANPQGDLQYKILENSMAEIRAMREERNREDRLRTEKEIAELKARPSGLDELVFNEEKAAKVRKIFGGTDSGAANEFTLKKGEMDQTERLENKKLDWEMKKWELDKEKEGSTLETVKEILAGPAGEILKNFGSAGADRIRGNKASPPSGQAPSPQIAQIKCPNCAGAFSVNTQLPTIQCPLCGVQLQNGNQPAQSQDMPKDQPPSDSTQTQSSPIPAQEKPADQTVEVESPVEQIATKE